MQGLRARGLVEFLSGPETSAGQRTHQYTAKSDFLQYYIGLSRGDSRPRHRGSQLVQRSFIDRDPHRLIICVIADASLKDWPSQVLAEQRTLLEVEQAFAIGERMDCHNADQWQGLGHAP